MSEAELDRVATALAPAMGSDDARLMRACAEAALACRDDEPYATEVTCSCGTKHRVAFTLKAFEYGDKCVHTVTREDQSVSV